MLSTWQVLGPALPVPAASLLGPAMMGAFCQAHYRCCLRFSSIRQLGDLDASLPAVCLLSLSTERGTSYFVCKLEILLNEHSQN